MRISSLFQVSLLILTAGKTYLFRIMNIGAMPAFFFNIEDHNMTIVAMDGIYTQRTTAQTLNVGTGQRFDVLVTMKPDTSRNYDISALIDMSAFNPETESVYKGPAFARASLDYSPNTNPAQSRKLEEFALLLPPIDDITISPLEEQLQPRLGPVDRNISLEVFREKSVPNGIPR